MMHHYELQEYMPGVSALEDGARVAIHPEIHFEVTELFTLIDRIRTFFDADSPGMVYGRNGYGQFFTFLTRTLNQIMRGDADNALINVIIDCAGAEMAVDAVSDEYFTGGIGGALELSAHQFKQFKELRGRLVIRADL